MKLIEQSINVWGECPDNIEEAKLWIEKAGRTCYDSRDKIADGSADKFIDNIINDDHSTVLEHSNFVVSMLAPSRCDGFTERKFFNTSITPHSCFIGANYRAWMDYVEAKAPEDLYRYIASPECTIIKQSEIPQELKRITVEFVTSRVVTHELVRHRLTSPSQASQRYIRYDNMEFIKPLWFDDYSAIEKELFLRFLSIAEISYKELLKKGSPQKARIVLPNQTAARIVMTTTIEDWKNIFKLRCSKHADPQMRDIMLKVKYEFVERGYV